TGVITVAACTPKRRYEYHYQICEVLNPSNCDDAIAIVVVEQSAIDAIHDLYRDINGKNGATLPSVLDNDLLDHTSFDPAWVTLTPGSAVTPDGPLPGFITMNATTGVITVAAETPAGHYLYPYRICEVLNPLNCDDAVAEIMVVAPAIVA